MRCDLIVFLAEQLGHGMTKYAGKDLQLTSLKNDSFSKDQRNFAASSAEDRKLRRIVVLPFAISS
jgi:hypothetical protein